MSLTFDLMDTNGSNMFSLQEVCKEDSKLDLLLKHFSRATKMLYNKSDVIEIKS